MASSSSAPAVTRDPRFRAGRTLIQDGRASEGAVDIFATLLEETLARHGDTSIDAAACYYEYGNALFRSVQASNEEEVEDEGGSDTKGPATRAAEAAQKRAAQSLDSKSSSVEETNGDLKPAAKTTQSEENDDGAKSEALSPEAANIGKTDDDSEDDDDIALALEMMETAWSVLDAQVQQERDQKVSPSRWSQEQLPRFLLGIGDVLSHQALFPDAADAYSRALPYREELLASHDKEELTLEHLQHGRQLAEVNILVAETLLACPDGEDVITGETGETLVKAAERVDYARGYYDKARDELQETVFLMMKVAEKNLDVETEKQDICFLSTLVMAVGISLAECDERAAAEAATHPNKKHKTG